MNNGIILIGGGGHCKACIDVLEQEGKHSIAGIVETNTNKGQKQLGYSIIGTDTDLPSLIKQYSCLIAIGQIKDVGSRLRIYNKLQDLGADMPVVISPQAYVSRHARIGQGTIIMHGAIINADAEIGKNCIINSRALVEHDAVIKDHCHISTGAIINGGAVVDQQTFIGSQAEIREYIKIGEQSLIGAGETILNNITTQEP